MQTAKNWCDGERVKKLGILWLSKQGLVHGRFGFELAGSPFLPSFPCGPASSLYHARAKDSLIYAAATSWVSSVLRGKNSKITWSFLHARSAGISPWFHIFVDGTEHASSCEIQVSQPAFSQMGTRVSILECVYLPSCTNNICDVVAHYFFYAVHILHNTKANEKEARIQGTQSSVLAGCVLRWCSKGMPFPGDQHHPFT